MWCHRKWPKYKELGGQPKVNRPNESVKCPTSPPAPTTKLHASIVLYPKLHTTYNPSQHQFLETTNGQNNQIP